MADQPPPSMTSAVIATAIIAGLVGYFFAQAQSIGIFGGAPVNAGPGKGKRVVDLTDHKDENEDDAEEEDEEDEDINGFEDDKSECKLVLVVRTDLGMTKGKIAAQASHATLACYKTLLNSTSPAAKNILRRWENYGQAKVAVQVKSEEELEVLQAQAISLGICAKIIHDAGRTQIAAGSATVLGVGPAPKAKIDLVTGSLKLL